MYYMKNAEFKLGGKKVNLKWLAAIFAFATVLTLPLTGAASQSSSQQNSFNEISMNH